MIVVVKTVHTKYDKQSLGTIGSLNSPSVVPWVQLTEGWRLSVLSQLYHGFSITVLSCFIVFNVQKQSEW